MELARHPDDSLILEPNLARFLACLMHEILDAFLRQFRLGTLRAVHLLALAANATEPAWLFGIQIQISLNYGRIHHLVVGVSGGLGRVHLKWQLLDLSLLLHA